VRVETLDDIAAKEGVEYIDFLKIDTEGHELAVLSGASRLLREIESVTYSSNSTPCTFIAARFQGLQEYSLRLRAVSTPAEGAVAARYERHFNGDFRLPEHPRSAQIAPQIADFRVRGYSGI